MHHIELMMAIVVASTTFIGLTGVVIVQTLDSSYLSAMERKNLRARLVYLPLVFGLVATMCAVGWLSGQNPVFELIAATFFGFQIISFWVIAIEFWVRRR